MSTDEEIREVFYQDIAEKNKQVLGREGLMPFLDDSGITIHDAMEGILSEDDKRFLADIEAYDIEPLPEPTDEEIVTILKGIVADGIDIIDLADGDNAEGDDADS